MDKDQEVSRRLKEWREGTDIAQDAVAEVLQMSQSSYSRRETGISTFSAGEAIQAARYLKADIRKIFD